MNQLVAVELRRLFARRLFKAISAIALLVFAVVGILTFVASDDSPERVRQAEAQRQADIATCTANLEAQAAAGDGPAPGEITQICKDEVYGSDPRFPYADMTWIIGTFGVPLMMLGWLLGASFMGAEWKDRTVTTTLTWERRRGRVLAAKAVALVLVSFSWIVLLQAFFLAFMYPAAAFEGSLAGVDGAWWRDTGLLLLRSGGLAAMASLFGLSLATIGRNTSAALGIGFVYIAVIEGMIRGFKPSWVDWLIGDNAALILIGDLDVNHLGHSSDAAALLLLAYSAAILALAIVFFKRRDIS